MRYQNTEFVLSAASPKDFIADGRPQVLFAGKSNVGKSSTLNSLLSRRKIARVSATPGKTVFVNYFLVDTALYFVDLPGYGYAAVSKAEQRRFSELMSDFFSDTSAFSLGIQIVDIRHKPTALDCEMSALFLSLDIPFFVIANKQDKIKNSQVPVQIDLIRETLLLPETVPVFPFSAEKNSGKEAVLAEISRICDVG